MPGFKARLSTRHFPLLKCGERERERGGQHRLFLTTSTQGRLHSGAATRESAVVNREGSDPASIHISLGRVSLFLCVLIGCS